MAKVCWALVAVLAFGWDSAPGAPPPVTVSRIVPAQPSEAAPDQIGVLVFFDFSPASRALLARLGDWASGAGRRIVLDREPFLGSGSTPLARAFVVARTLGVTDSVLPGLYALAARVSDGGDMTAAIAKVFAPVGINEIEFTAAWNSPATDAGLVRARAMAARFEVTQAPLLIVNGLWRLVPAAGADATSLLAALNRQIAVIATGEAANR